MKTIIDYKCKFCRTPRAIEVDAEENGRLNLTVEKWVPILCCPECGKFQIAKRKLGYKIIKSCYVLMLARQSNDQEQAGNVRKFFEILTAKYSALVCTHYGFETVDASEFVDQLMDQPNKSQILMKVFEDGIKRLRVP